MVRMLIVWGMNWMNWMNVQGVGGIAFCLRSRHFRRRADAAPRQTRPTPRRTCLSLRTPTANYRGDPEQHYILAMCTKYAKRQQVNSVNKYIRAKIPHPTPPRTKQQRGDKQGPVGDRDKWKGKCQGGDKSTRPNSETKWKTSLATQRPGPKINESTKWVKDRKTYTKHNTRTNTPNSRQTRERRFPCTRRQRKTQTWKKDTALRTPGC